MDPVITGNVTCDGQAPHPGQVILLVAECYRNQKFFLWSNNGIDIDILFRPTQFTFT
jgi:hypothetical protein